MLHLKKTSMKNRQEKIVKNMRGGFQICIMERSKQQILRMESE